MEDYKNHPKAVMKDFFNVLHLGKTERGSFANRENRGIPLHRNTYELSSEAGRCDFLGDFVNALHEQLDSRNRHFILGYESMQNDNYANHNNALAGIYGARWSYSDPWNHRDVKSEQVLIAKEILSNLLRKSVFAKSAISEVASGRGCLYASSNDSSDWEYSSSVSGGSGNGIGSAEPSQPSGGQDDDDAFLAFLEEAAGNVATEVDAPISAPEIELLGGAIAIGQSVVTPDDLVRAIESGFRPAVLDHLIENGFEKGEIERLVAPLRTQQRRRKEGRLSPSESDVTCRLARVLIRAEGTLGNRARAFSWLRRPNRSFADATPMTLLGTEAGGRRVEELLLRADFGMMA
ncbi:DUF2384 domain-containing protein [Azospirillum sp. YIM DDC1]|uniref:DUF2384 domain-containing protein n=2 Tax=Azospirillum aestuarii TaxID=2802052 RepID=A0ABS1I5S6_9PROT|nr:DUF2384 domain-containing protein [Azospirillum aestuarii]